MKQRGGTLVEVVVMMVIISIALVGVYSLVNNAQRLAKKTDDRLIASNLAKEGIESVGALRDTFLLRAYDVSGCFFTIDASSEGSRCYETDKEYFLTDEATLSPVGSPRICIGEDGWYTQENAATGIACADALPCGSSRQKACLTRFSRTIKFAPCDTKGLHECVLARTSIMWGTGGGESLSLEQIFTRH